MGEKSPMAERNSNREVTCLASKASCPTRGPSQVLGAAAQSTTHSKAMLPWEQGWKSVHARCHGYAVPQKAASMLGRRLGLERSCHASWRVTLSVCRTHGERQAWWCMLEVPALWRWSRSPSLEVTDSLTGPSNPPDELQASGRPCPKESKGAYK